MAVHDPCVALRPRTSCNWQWSSPWRWLRVRWHVWRLDRRYARQCGF